MKRNLLQTAISVLTVGCLLAGNAPADVNRTPRTVPDEQTGENAQTTDDEGQDAQDAEDRKDDKGKKEQGEVASAFKKLRFFHGKPMKDAKFYVYLQSASWCGPCCKEMPEIVKEYKKMKAAKVEIILVGFDRSKKEAEAYLKRFKAKFPGIMKEDGAKLPGFKLASGIPNATFVDADGKVLRRGHGSIIREWESIIAAPASAE